MTLLPEWAPNIHPLIVHFPLSLLFLATAVDVAGLALRRVCWLTTAAAGLYVLGALGAVAAFYTGRAAASTVLLPAAAESVLTEHADWALRVVWFYGLYGAARVLLSLRTAIRARAAHLALVLVGGAGLALVAVTGDHGGQLVYRYGLGVSREDGDALKAHDHSDHPTGSDDGAPSMATTEHAGDGHPGGGPHDEEQEATGHEVVSGEASPGVSTADEFEVAGDGSWAWAAKAGADAVLRQEFSWLAGSSDLAEMVIQVEHHGEHVVALRVAGERVLLVAGEAVRDMQLEVEVNLDGLDGRIGLVHHVQDVDNYDYLAADSTSVSLGRVTAGKVLPGDPADMRVSGWRSLRAVGQGTHFRGYIDDRMVVHGHGDAPEAGRAGLLVEGTGVLLLRSVRLSRL